MNALARRVVDYIFKLRDERDKRSLVWLDYEWTNQRGSKVIRHYPGGTSETIRGGEDEKAPASAAAPRPPSGAGAISPAAEKVMEGFTLKRMKEVLAGRWPEVAEFRRIARMGEFLEGNPEACRELDAARKKKAVRRAAGPA